MLSWLDPHSHAAVLRCSQVWNGRCLLSCVPTAFGAKILPLPSAPTAFAAEALPLPCAPAAFVAKALPLPCAAIAFVAKALPLPEPCLFLWCRDTAFAVCSHCLRG